MIIAEKKISRERNGKHYRIRYGCADAKSNGGYFMNNEINRRDFMKLSVASIMTASVTLNLGNTAFATTASENPKDVLKIF